MPNQPAYSVKSKHPFGNYFAVFTAQNGVLFEVGAQKS
jgi:hypothetical protein